MKGNVTDFPLEWDFLKTVTVHKFKKSPSTWNLSKIILFSNKDRERNNSQYEMRSAAAVTAVSNEWRRVE